MPKGTRYTPEQIISKLREAEVVISKGPLCCSRRQDDRSSRTDVLPLAKRIRRSAD